VAGGLDKAPAQGKKVGCETIQVFAKSPYMWKGVPISDEAAEGFRAGVRAEGLERNAVHQGYLVNLASPKPPALKMSKIAFLDELGRAEKIGVDYLIFHPGAHLKAGVPAGIDTLVASLDELFAATPGYRVRALLENSAGQGSTLCARFEELAEVLRRLKEPKRAGVALDTCHLFAAGYDLRSVRGYRG
jgi:deoxyribonuclease-4